MNRFSLPLLGALVLLSGLIAGCDTAEIDEVDDRPTVSFGTAGVNAPEGTTASIPVTLTGGTGQPVTVEVLFASRIAGTGRATAGEDFTGFGEVRNGLTVATVTFSGAATETQTITFAVTADGVIEAAETASFVLQNAQGARIVTPRELSLTIGIPPISSARARPNDAVVTVEGIVTRAAGRYVLIQDETAGIVVFASNTTPFGADVEAGRIKAGDRVQLTGALTEFQNNGIPGEGLLQINAASIPAGGYQVLNSGNALPAPQRVTLAQIAAPGDTYESEVVCITNLTINPAGDVVFSAGSGGGKTYVVTDASGSIDFRIGNQIETSGPQRVVGSLIPTGRFAYVGVVGQFRGANQLSPFLEADIRPSNTCS